MEKLEEAVSLAVQLKEMQAEVESALLDVESLVEFVEIPTNGNPEEIKNELESSKVCFLIFLYENCELVMIKH